ncbi:response regulator [Aeromonas veronii]
MNKHYLILCVDDEREVLDAVIHDLAPFRSHFELEAAESVDEARAVVEEWERDGNKLALILCDHIMPGTLGIDFLVELNRRASTRASRKLLLTGQAGLEATVEAVNRGGLHYYLAKPWKLETLQEAVREQLTDYLLAEDGENAFHFAPLLNQARLFAAIHDHPFDE